jgi:hypothetical protein
MAAFFASGDKVRLRRRVRAPRIGEIMFGRRRIRRAHARFLEACRSLRDERGYWSRMSAGRRWIVELLTGSSVFALHPEGKRLLDALRDLERRCVAEPLAEEGIRDYHRAVFPGGGRYRTTDLDMPRNVFTPPSPDRLPRMMRQLDDFLRREQQTLDDRPDPAAAMRLAVTVHLRLGLIHPFVDANGRVARLAMNHVLRRYRLGYVLYPALDESESLWKALGDAGKGRHESLFEFAASCLHSV